jgi:hypothetical protein
MPSIPLAKKSVYYHWYEGLKTGFLWARQWKLEFHKNAWHFLISRACIRFSRTTLMHGIGYSTLNAASLSIVAYKPVAKQWLCKQQPLQRNDRNIETSDNRRMVFSMSSAPLPLLSNGAVNTPLQQERGFVFCVVRAEELSCWQLALQFRKYKRLKLDGGQAYDRCRVRYVR